MVSLTRRAKLALGTGVLLVSGRLLLDELTPRPPLQHIIRASAELSPQMRGWLRKDKGWTHYCIDIYTRSTSSYEAKARLCQDQDQLAQYPYADPYWRSRIRGGEQLLNEMRRASDDVPVAYAVSMDGNGACRLRYTEVYAPFKAADELCPIAHRLIREHERKKSCKQH